MCVWDSLWRALSCSSSLPHGGALHPKNSLTLWLSKQDKLDFKVKAVMWLGVSRPRTWHQSSASKRHTAAEATCMWWRWLHPQFPVWLCVVLTADHTEKSTLPFLNFYLLLFTDGVTITWSIHDDKRSNPTLFIYRKSTTVASRLFML